MRTAIFAALILSTAPALADDKCAQAEKIARTAMEARQVGVPLVEIIKVADGNAFLIEVSKEAYRRSQYTTTAYRERAINEFANEVYLICLDSGETP